MSGNMKLYEISELYHDFLYAVDNGEIEDEQAIADTLEAIEGTFADKVDNIANIIQQYEALAKVWKEKADSILERAKQKQAQADSLKRYLAKHMLDMGTTRFESADNKITFRKSESVNILDVSAFIEYAQKNGMDDYLKYKAPEPNKTALKAAIKNGAEFEGVELVEKQNIQIK